MSTLPKPTFAITAKYLGPVLNLEGELTKGAQNLIFARNGTGKSFLSRAFRYLDLHGQAKEIGDAARNLVSDESVDGNGTFSFSRGTDAMGMLELQKTGDKVIASVADTIFHVFSDDFVHDELREREYEIDGEIENQISVDSENIKLSDAQTALRLAQAEEESETSALMKKYDREKISEINEKAGINKQLKEYKTLSLEALLAQFENKPEPSEKSFAELLKDLDSLRAIPAEPVYPENLELIKWGDVDLKPLEISLQKVTSLSSVSEDIKFRINEHHEFYELGTKIVRSDHSLICPFCEQGITEPNPKAIIDAYIRYFEDEEEKHKSELRELFRDFNYKLISIGEIETQLTRQKSRYDALKRFIPSKNNTATDDAEAHLKQARDTIIAIKVAIHEKAGALSTMRVLPNIELATCIASINKAIENNNLKASELKRAIEKSDEERKGLQRKACAIFDFEFAIDNWSSIETVRTFRTAAKLKQSALSELEKSGPSTDARVRVAETFETLLKEFFAEKYIFDKDRFILKRGDREMLRGPHRTLSDGEKTAIAFCYFVACIHRKVAANSDYRKLFLIFDDPVTSMSYDFVFSIAQTLKNLNISNLGEISVNPGKIDGNKCWRPELLILTHSTYFFNISRTNKIVQDDATFSLQNNGLSHRLVRLNVYVAPFEQQLAHIYEVANGKEPDHGTGNSIRSVLEAIGRFCRPDKSKDLGQFLIFLAGEKSIAIKSALINSLSHGTYYDETPTPEDIRLACREAINVVEIFAIGQIELIKSAMGTK